MNTIKDGLPRWISLIAVAMLAACTPSLQSRAPVPEVYVLRPVVADIELPVGLSVQVLPVRARPGYATADVLRADPGRRLGLFAASRWPDTLPRVMEGLLVDGLKAAGIPEVLEPVSAGRGSLLLQAVIRRFDADYSEGATSPTVHVALDVTVLDGRGRSVLQSFSVESRVAASDNRMGPIVAAFERASAEVLVQIARRIPEASAPKSARPN